MKSVILTGLRANNDLTIGNYFGALLPLNQMAAEHANEYQINLFIRDLHSFTTSVDHSQLKNQIMLNIKTFVASGLPLENDSVFLYRQSYIPAHSELTWILDCFTSFGEMNRMTQFKDKSRDLSSNQNSEELEATENGNKNINNKAISVGLFNYPVLMASDILLYNTKYIPVGEDQTQHLEFARDIAIRFNNKFKPTFTVPESVQQQNKFFGRKKALRIMDLVDPSKKMSKSSDSDKGVIFMSDSPEDVRSKIMSATTDSLSKIQYSPNSQPGISNLLDLMALLEDSTVEEVAKRYDNQTQYGLFKTELADKMAKFISDFKDKLEKVSEQAIISKLEKSERVMNEQANAKLYQVQKLIGIR